MNRAELVERFPRVCFPSTAVGLYEGGGAGWIKVRALVAAQLAVATSQGAKVVRDEVVELRRDGEAWTLRMHEGTSITAARVLVCAHGYSPSLLQAVLGRTVALENQAHTTVYAELTPTRRGRCGTLRSEQLPERLNATSSYLPQLFFSFTLTAVLCKTARARCRFVAAPDDYSVQEKYI